MRDTRLEVVTIILSLRIKKISTGISMMMTSSSLSDLILTASKGSLKTHTFSFTRSFTRTKWIQLILFPGLGPQVSTNNKRKRVLTFSNKFHPLMNVWLTSRLPRETSNYCLKKSPKSQNLSKRPNQNYWAKSRTRFLGEHRKRSRSKIQSWKNCRKS